MQTSRLLGMALVVSSVLALGACEDASEKAQRKYESSLTLVEEGDVDRALVELRGVFDLNGQHLEARLLYADLLVEQGRISDAYGHYLLAVEQYPNDTRARLAIVDILLKESQWKQAEPHLDVIVEQGVDTPQVQAMLLARDMITASENKDSAAFEQISADAQALLETDPSLDIARNVLIDSLVQLGNLYDALEALDAGLAIDPLHPRRQELRLRLLDQLGDKEAVGAQLRTMTDLFPDVEQYEIYLLQWFVRIGDLQSAEDFLLSDIERSGDDSQPRVSYIQFLMQTQSPEIALEQVNKFIEDGSDDALFRMIGAGIRYDMGQRDEAIAEVESLLDGAEPSNDVRDHQMALARMYLGVGETEKASQLVDTVLSQDAFHVAALKMRADELINQDRIGDAILTLRSGLDQAPQDPDIRSLLAKAHERDGNRELMGENLAQAVQNSESRPAESLRYARFLMSQEKYQSARDIVLQSLRRNPTDLQLLRTLSEIYIGLADWPRTEQIIKALRSLDDPQATLLANGLEATILQRLQRTDESLTLLRGMLDDKSTAIVAQAAIIRTHLANGDIGAARTFMDGVLAEAGDDQGTLFLNAALLSVEGELDAANDIYRTLLEKNPQQEAVWRALVAGLTRAGDPDAAAAALDDALEYLPESRNLLWVQASNLEQSGDFEGAIAIYERLYDESSDSAIVANNLASLISTRRDTEEDLQLAYKIARRLKGTEIPAFQDTYGWISFRMGREEEALEYLQKAATGLPNDPLVQEHLAEALIANGNPAEARIAYEKSLALMPADSSDARTRIEAKIVELGESSQEQ